MATTEGIRERIAAFARELAEELGEADESNSLSWLDAVESQVVEIGDAVSVELLKRRSQRQPMAEEESVCPKCAKLGRYQGDHPRELIGRRGKVTICEPEYFCPCCRKAFFPADQANRR